MEHISFLEETDPSRCDFLTTISDHAVGCGIGRWGIARDDVLYGITNGDGFGAYKDNIYGDGTMKGYGLGNGDGKGKGWSCGDKEWYRGETDET